MLEVNDFNAVRISLASPEQIRSWSYGEVTKPETINYRTLKPEKDGLFCERIFGPTRDFECYCGKYKRVRYKGVVCDKCGVEVARSKVRRERMGHIELAAPVSHIWFAKGMPSRIGLLLDLSPRSLDQVLYFARFIITELDEKAREQAIKEVQENTFTEIARLEKATSDKVEELKAHLEEEVKRLQELKEAEAKPADEELSKVVGEIMNQATELEAKLTKGMGRRAAQEIAFGDAKLVAKGKTLKKTHLVALRDAVSKRIEEAEAAASRAKESKAVVIDAETDRLTQETNQQIDSLGHPDEADKAALIEEMRRQIEDLEDLKKGKLVVESSYRELREHFGHVFKAGIGAEAIYTLLSSLDLEKMRAELQQEIKSSSGQRRKKATKRLGIVEAFRKSGNKPEWMILTLLPVLPPELRPMVQLDGGRFATSDLNDLYRRVINRNNRLRRLLELGAPDIIIRNEKRMLQEAVDSLIDNGKRGRAVTTSNNHRLKSLSDMLRGKQGRFRQNLLGKRVDYSGRSVIVVGPELKLHQCGLPKRMALELFKPMVMHRLMQLGLAHNIKSAKRIVERVRPEVWDVLESVTKDHPVLLNRAPTLHRLGIQAFQPVLIEGSAIQIHPLVCAAFNADFDGDQMAVHVPLSRAAVEEASQVMLSIYNMLSPSSGEPLVTPTLDMVLGCYYLTLTKPGTPGEGMKFASFDEVKLAYDLGLVHLQAEIEVRDSENGGRLKTSPGRIIFNEALPKELGFHNRVMDKKSLKEVIAECYRRLGNQTTAGVVDEIKRLGFRYATKSGSTISISDVEVPTAKSKLLEEADKKIAEIEKQYRLGLLAEDERYKGTVDVYNQATEEMSSIIERSLSRYGSIYMMATSGAKGNIAQIRQMAGMRGLMSDPSGRIIDLLIRSSFREGLSVLEYFISTHGARKGLADTALRTADSGYLTRRLVDVAQEVIVLEEDCGTTSGIWVEEHAERGILATIAEHIVGRWAAAPVAHPETGEVIVSRNQEIDQAKAQEIAAAGIKKVYVRSPLSCQAKRGVCRYCYGWSMATGRLVNLCEAVGIIAAQSIGEPGTQLTMRTFHTGGVAGVDITSGLPRVEELFEARSPKGQAIICEIDGFVDISSAEEGRRIKVTSSEFYPHAYAVPAGSRMLVQHGQEVEIGTPLAEPPPPSAAEDTGVAPSPVIKAEESGQVLLEGDQVTVIYEERDEREYLAPATARVLAQNGARVRAGDQLTEGAMNPQDILRIMGREAVQRYLVDEVQKVYRSQGVNINDKHIETIVRQMLRKVRVNVPGDTNMLPGELVDQFVFDEVNAKVLAEGGEPATAQTVLLGVTKASLNTSSFLAAASFQETTRVLTEAAVNGSVDRLLGLKENVIIGKLIPAHCHISKEEGLLGEPVAAVPAGALPAAPSTPPSSTPSALPAPS